jgi:tetratricopeptide (TPR) repeat protein
MAYLEAGRVGESVTELEGALSRYDLGRASLPIWAVKAYYLLGLAYERSGWNQKAIDRYDEFLRAWKDADPGLKDVEDARARLARLKASS